MNDPAAQLLELVEPLHDAVSDSPNRGIPAVWRDVLGTEDTVAVLRGVADAVDLAEEVWHLAAVHGCRDLMPNFAEVQHALAAFVVNARIGSAVGELTPEAIAQLRFLSRTLESTGQWGGFDQAEIADVLADITDFRTAMIVEDDVPQEVRRFVGESLLDLERALAMHATRRQPAVRRAIERALGGITMLGEAGALDTRGAVETVDEHWRLVTRVADIAQLTSEAALASKPFDQLVEAATTGGHDTGPASVPDPPSPPMTG